MNEERLLQDGPAVKPPEKTGQVEKEVDLLRKGLSLSHDLMDKLCHRRGKVLKLSKTNRREAIIN